MKKKKNEKKTDVAFVSLSKLIFIIYFFNFKFTRAPTQGHI